jgi:hypothetical protein
MAIGSVAREDRRVHGFWRARGERLSKRLKNLNLENN